MKKTSLLKWAILGLGIICSLFILSKGPKETLGFVLGLDLRGGVSFVVQIDEDGLKKELGEKWLDDNPGWRSSGIDVQARIDERYAKERSKNLAEAQERALQVIRSRINGLGIREAQIYAERESRIVIQLPGVDAKTRNEAEATLGEVGRLSFHLVHPDNDRLAEKLLSDELAPPDFRITLVPDGRGGTERGFVYSEGTANTESQRAIRSLNPRGDYELMMMRRESVNGEEFYLPRFVRTRHELTGELLKRTWPSIGAMGEAYVNLQFDKAGTKIFRGLTEKYAADSPRNRDEGKSGRMLAIVLDGVLYSAPVLRAVIYDGSARIEGIRSVLEATHLVKVLNAGSLPAPIKIIQKHEVDASLGRDSIQSGTRAVVYGGIAVLAFMVVYYMFCGVVADLALLLDLILLPLGMVIAAGFLGNFVGGGGSRDIALPVLTLPGIAGILLTIGIAVDANVLIFERIREEMGAGKTIRGAVSAGYDRAFTTILDANITTLLTGIILFIWGSGPVRGFAVTLCGGIIVSLFTALVVTRLIFEVSLDKLRLTKLRMLSVIKDTKINFVGKRGIAAILSVGIILSTWVLLGMKYQKDPGKVFGVDFTDGTSVTLGVGSPDKKPEVAPLRDALNAVGIKANIQYKRPIGGGVGDEKLLIRLGLSQSDSPVGNEAETAVTPSQVAVKAIQEGFPEASFVKESEDAIGAQVGAELRRSAVWAIALALVGIVIYISWRFRFSFAMGAIIALAHDVAITIGIYCVVFGRELSLPIIAALLTIVGYSVNDTIVVFDRIREDIKNSELRRTMNYKEICNLSINQTLSRTIMTSLTTLIAVGLLLLVGGGAINDFALALCIGVLVGTYSSIFVATPVMLLWHGNKPLPKKRS